MLEGSIFSENQNPSHELEDAERIRRIEILRVNLVPLLHVPNTHKTIIIWDSDPDAIADMKAILDFWPNVTVEFVDTKDHPTQKTLPTYGDIWLVSEHLGVVNDVSRWTTQSGTFSSNRGFMTASLPRILGPQTKFISITLAPKPKWTDELGVPHFNQKDKILNVANPSDLIKMINPLL
jgi:hypothetical protein